MNINEQLTLSHYKEPLKPVEGGYGYLGALSVTLDGDKMQCHICGELFRELSKHVYNRHKLSVSDYKTKFGLARQTVLISETVRQERKMKTIQWYKSLSPEEKIAHQQKAREGAIEWHKSKRDNRFKIRLETKNKRGTCPDQLLEKIKEVEKVLGRTPSKAEFIAETGTQRYIHLIYKTFGSWGNALKMLGMSGKTRHKQGGRRNYSDEELLEYLCLFFQEEGKIPTFTDFNRGLLPSYQTYQHRFGSVPRARELAGIEGTPTRWGVKEEITV